MEQNEIEPFAAYIRRRSGCNFAALVDGQMLGQGCDQLFAEFVCSAIGYDDEARKSFTKGQAADR